MVCRRQSGNYGKLRWEWSVKEKSKNKRNDAIQEGKEGEVRKRVREKLA